jgi:hypothetical protein
LLSCEYSSDTLRTCLKEGQLCSAAPLDMRKWLLAAIAEMMRMRNDPASFERMFR